MVMKPWMILVALLVAGCQREQWDDCVTSAGPARVEERSVGSYHAVDLDDRLDLVIEARAAGSVAVEGGANLLGQVETEVSDGVLRLRNTMRCNWVRDLKKRITVRIASDGLDRLELRGTGHVWCTDTVHADRFELEQWGAQGSARLLLEVESCAIGLHTGAGDVVAAGRCHGAADLFSGIMGPIDASQLQARLVRVNNSGVADVRCWATDQLDAQINDVGDVYYRGDPSIIHQQITGSGRLLHE